VATGSVIDLLRHGEPAGGRRLRGARTDDALTPAGRQAMARITEREAPWERIVASPLVRCRTFAEDLAARLGVGIRVDARLAEYDFGDWDGQPLDALWAQDGERLAAFLGDPDSVTPPGGESATAFRARVSAAWNDLRGAGAGERVLVVGHGGVLRQLVAEALGVAGLHTALEWPPAALSRLRLFAEEGSPVCATLAFHARVADA